jgi:hypothetical protein
MSLQDLHKRYLWIAKNSLEFLKEKGFQKKGAKYFKQKNDFILRIYPEVPRAWLNQDHRYEFNISWELESCNEGLINLYIFMGANKNLKGAWLIVNCIAPEQFKGNWDLTDKNPPGFDQQYAEEITKEIKKVILPLFDQINSIEDIIQLAEKEAMLEQQKRKFFPHGVYAKLARLYAYKGWKEKTLEMCDKDIEETPVTARCLAEKRKNKYIKYFEQSHKDKK